MSQNLVDRRQPPRPLTVEEALERLSQRLAWYGPTVFKVGRIVILGETQLMAEIVSTSGKVIRKLEIDRSTGAMRLVDGFTKAALMIDPFETNRSGPMKYLIPHELGSAGATNLRMSVQRATD